MEVQIFDPHSTLIRTDGGTQMRPKLSREVIDDYKTALQEGQWHWPSHPYPVVYADGSAYWLADGEQRLTACREANQPFHADVRRGSLQDAIWYGIAANQDHGLRRSNEAKRNSVVAALHHPNGRTMSDRELADHCGVSHTFVANVRKDQGIDESERTGKDGRKINVARIGRGSPLKQIDKWWKQAPLEDRKAIYQRVTVLARQDFGAEATP